jgi:NAD(P)-dependent dehydrogenase (short-subunit alcohol dehydrogenase family)
LSSPTKLAEIFAFGSVASAKHGVIGLLRSLTGTGLPSPKIRVNAIAPNWTKSGLVHPAIVSLLEQVKATIQEPDIPARSVAICMVDDGSEASGRPRRHGQMIFTNGGRYVEIEESILAKTSEIVSPFEGVGMAEIWEYFQNMSAAK